MRILASCAASAVVAAALVAGATPAIAATPLVQASVDGTTVNGPYPLGLCQRYAADAARQGVGRVSPCYSGYGGYYFTWFV